MHRRRCATADARDSTDEDQLTTSMTVDDDDNSSSRQRFDDDDDDNSDYNGNKHDDKDHYGGGTQGPARAISVVPHRKTGLPTFARWWRRNQRATRVAARYGATEDTKRPADFVQTFFPHPLPRPRALPLAV
ncbi:PREDICTED: uncharacterized protein LOC106749909 [Dinoponera quadriceps]|uniref:Uncharacterized protein LOC106749909 n=1 Tax=Dinoponera quadriceps TaxID=609295 RepID=A0A6P3Y398_DINQU|nr:PREDICTED: uncharacterized protein LOC106749909 [Dinoponera quadriceps]